MTADAESAGGLGQPMERVSDAEIDAGMTKVPPGPIDRVLLTFTRHAVS